MYTHTCACVCAHTQGSSMTRLLCQGCFFGGGRIWCYIYACMFRHVLVYMCLHVEGRICTQCLPPSFATIFTEAESLGEPGACQFDLVCSSLIPGTPCLHLPCCGTTGKPPCLHVGTGELLCLHTQPLLCSVLNTCIYRKLLGLGFSPILLSPV